MANSIDRSGTSEPYGLGDRRRRTAWRSSGVIAARARPAYAAAAPPRTLDSVPCARQLWRRADRRPREATMPTARESLLDAAYTALAAPPWSAVRMVDVAAVRRGVPADALQRVRQQGRARPCPGPARGRRAISRASSGRWPPTRTRASGWSPTPSGPRRRPGATPLVRALLTGCWSERLPAPTLSAVPSSSAVPAQRRADGPLPSPADLVALVRDRAVAALAASRPDERRARPRAASSSCGSRCPVWPRRRARAG